MDWKGEGELYAFVDAVPPPQGPGARHDVLFDAVGAPEFREGLGEEEGSLCLVRVMSTHDRLRMLFQIGELAEGQWYRAKLRHQPGMPIAWVLPAANDYSGPVSRMNLVGLDRLAVGVDPSGAPSDGGRLTAWCQTASEQARRQPPVDALMIASGPAGAVAPSRMHVRVLDVGHASCAALHVLRAPDSQIVGYCDVGRPIFFHAGSAPAGLAATEGGRIPSRGFVLLSHWDFDHYSMAVSRGMKSLQQLDWYAPDQAVGPNAAKLQRDLGGRLSLINSPHFLLGRGLSLYRGRGPSGDRNGNGYAVRLDQNEDSVLLPGDVGYSQIAPAATTGLTGLIATHHGGSGGSAPPAGNGPAIVSYGKPNRYGHPAAAEMTALSGAGWSVACTAEHGGVARGDRWLTAP